jgi:hypothetical protein
MTTPMHPRHPRHARHARPTKIWMALVAVAALAVAPAAARAQAAGPSTRTPPAPPAAAAAAPAADGAPKVKVEKGAGGKKIYRITDEIRIEGKIQKPEAFFFYQKSSINYDWQELKQDFIPKILDSVSRSPF